MYICSIIKQKEIMRAINFNNKATKIVTVKELEIIMNSIGMDWLGFESVSVNDREMFEEKTNISFEPTNDGNARLHDLDFVWEE
jgi:hypothetical protein